MCVRERESEERVCVEEKVKMKEGKSVYGAGEHSMIKKCINSL